jgi:hypothetical protein
MQPATALRRIFAVFIDFWVLGALWIGVGVVSRNGLGIVLFLMIDLLLTAFTGQSIGRLATRIRVVRMDGGGAPGIPRALARIAIVITTGWVFPLATSRGLHVGYGGLPRRFWWDAAAGTILVAAP